MGAAYRAGHRGGPIGLLAALLGVQKGLDVHVLDQVTTGLKPELVTALGATYHHGDIASTGCVPDIVLECTGVGQLVFDAMDAMGANAVLCLAGVSSKGRSLGIDAGEINRHMVLENDVVFGSVNANRSHYEAGAQALAHADPAWLGRLISRAASPELEDAYQHQPEDVKVVLEFSRSASVLARLLSTAGPLRGRSGTCRGPQRGCARSPR